MHRLSSTLMKMAGRNLRTGLPGEHSPPSGQARTASFQNRGSRGNSYPFPSSYQRHIHGNSNDEVWPRTDYSEPSLQRGCSGDRGNPVKRSKVNHDPMSNTNHSQTSVPHKQEKEQHKVCEDRPSVNVGQGPESQACGVNDRATETHHSQGTDKFDSLVLPVVDRGHQSSPGDSPMQHGSPSTSSGEGSFDRNLRKLSVLKRRLWEYTEFGAKWKRKPSSYRDKYEFKVICYNVLAQKLLEDNRNLYHHCHGSVLKWDFRKWNLLHEFNEVNGDILCLQEVQEDHYESFFKSSMRQMGFSGEFVKRSGCKTDGCATFIRDEKFQLVTSQPVHYFKRGCSVMDRDNVGLVVVVKPKHQERVSEQSLCVANTHLLFNPRRGDIKLLQIGLLMAELDKLAFKGLKDGQPVYNPILLCGDMNTRPFAPLYNMIVNGSLQYEGIEAAFISQQESPRRPKFLSRSLITPFVGISELCQYTDIVATRYADLSEEERKLYYKTDSGTLSHNLKLKSVYSHTLPKHKQYLPEVTTHHAKTSCTVDYIFHNGGVDWQASNLSKSGENCLKLVAKIGLVSDRDLSKAGGLPNALLSSDHLLLGAKFCLS